MFPGVTVNGGEKIKLVGTPKFAGIKSEAVPSKIPLLIDPDQTLTPIIVSPPLNPGSGLTSESETKSIESRVGIKVWPSG